MPTNADARGGVHATAARTSNSNTHRLPELPRAASATPVTDNTAEARDYVGDGRSRTDRLRDHWSQSSYSPGQIERNSIIFAPFIRLVQLLIFQSQWRIQRERGMVRARLKGL